MLGVALGLGGVMLVVSRKLGAGIGDWAGVGACVIGLLAFSVGTILQKWLSEDVPQRAAGAVQFGSGALCCLVGALIFEEMVIEWAAPMIVAMTWSIFVLSLGAVTLLYFLIRHGAASNVASMLFLVPPCTAIIAWGLFGEVMGWIERTGFAVTAIGVLMVNRPESFRRS